MTGPGCLPPPVCLLLTAHITLPRPQQAGSVTAASHPPGTIMPLETAVQTQLATAHSHERGIPGFLELTTSSGRQPPAHPRRHTHPPLPAGGGLGAQTSTEDWGKHHVLKAWRLCWRSPYLSRQRHPPRIRGRSPRPVVGRSQTISEDLTPTSVFWEFQDTEKSCLLFSAVSFGVLAPLANDHCFPFWKKRGFWDTTKGPCIYTPGQNGWLTSPGRATQFASMEWEGSCPCQLLGKGAGRSKFILSPLSE